MPDPILKASASKLKRSGSQVINDCSSFSLEETYSDIFSSKIRRRDQKKMEKRQYVSVNGNPRNMFQPCDFHYL